MPIAGKHLLMLSVMSSWIDNENIGDTRGDSVRCNLCGNSDVFDDMFKIASKDFYDSPMSARDVYTITRCSSCGLVFVREEVGEVEIRDIYSRGYYEGRDRMGPKDYLGEHKKKLRQGRLRKTLDNLAQELWFTKEYVDRGRLRSLLLAVPRIIGIEQPRSKNIDVINQYVSAPGRLLDVGCAMGLFLEQAKKVGWQVAGVEISEYSAAYAREHLNIDVFVGDMQQLVEDGVISPHSFDVVTVWDTLEHLQDPSGFLATLHRVLRPDGLLFLSTVNIDGVVAKRDGGDWHFFAPPGHLFYFSENTLKGFLKKAGFEIILDDDFSKDIVCLGAKKLGIGGE
jgi:2-polyprenyl-3-methyl-5-hydroxy-6-metoxy-1,4-benzoquinol methylase